MFGWDPLKQLEAGRTVLRCELEKAEAAARKWHEKVLARLS